MCVDIDTEINGYVCQYLGLNTQILKNSLIVNFFRIQGLGKRVPYLGGFGDRDVYVNSNTVLK